MQIFQDRLFWNYEYWILIAVGALIFLTMIGTMIALFHSKRASLASLNAVEMLRASEMRFQSVVENLSEGLMIFDSLGNLIYQNPGSLKIHGFDIKEEGKIPRDQLPGTWEAWNEAGQKIGFDQWPVSRVFRHERFQNQILRVRRVETGQEFYGSYNGSPIYGSNGEIALGFITIRDITRERQASLRTEHLQRLTSALSRANRFGEVVEAVVKLGGEALGPNLGKFALLDESSRKFSLIAGPGISPHVALQWQHFDAEAEFGATQAIKTRQPYYTRTRAEYLAKGGPNALVIAEAHQLQSEAVLPLIIGERLLGVLIFIFTESPQSFDKLEDAYLRAVAELCTQAVERTRLFEAEHAARDALTRAHEDLKGAAERVQLALAAGAIVGTWDWDITKDSFTVDERFAESFGIDPALGRHGLSLEQVIATVHPEDLLGLRAAISSAVSRGGPYSHEYRVRRRDGTYRWIEANGRVDLTSDGKPFRFPGVLLDIEQRRLLETERDRVTQLLRAFIDAVPGVVYAKDREGRMLVANRGVAELVGKPPEEFIGKTDLESLEHKDQALAVMANDRRIMESGQAETLEEEVSFPDGRQTTWLSTKEPFRDGKGHVIGLIGSSIDITERKLAEAELRSRTEELAEAHQRLERALHARDEFLSIASHELKTPITSLKLQAQMAKRYRDRGDPRAFERERISSLIDHTDKQVERLTRLVDDMLDISRIRAGKLSIQDEALDLGKLVSEVVERLSPNIKEAGLSVSLECQSSILIRGDRMRLEQVLNNLLTNAIKYGKRSPVQVRVFRSDNHPVRARIQIQDQGMGISPDARERIFDRFEREVNANEVSGLGLGLFISRQIIEAHGGKIWADSPGLDQGSIFQIELPQD